MARVPTNSQRSKARNDGLSRQMKRRVEHNRCPKCGRGDALKRIRDGDFWCTTCRWCDYARGGYDDAAPVNAPAEGADDDAANNV